jgi:HK97 family phage major capsid protein
MSDEIKNAADAVIEIKKGFEAFKEANETRLKEIEAKGAPDPLTVDKLNKIEADLDKAQKTADDAYLAVKRAQRMVADNGGDDLEAKAAKWGALLGKLQNTGPVKLDVDAVTAYKRAFDTYLRKDDRGMVGDEFKALSVGSDPDGGYVVHPDMSGRIVTQIFETSPMRAFASVQTISTDALEGLFDLDEAEAIWVAETQARNETGTPQLKMWRIPVHEMAAQPAATQKLLDDAEINMEAWLAAKVADKFARKENAAFVNGTGVEMPRGFLTYAAGTTLPGTIEDIRSTVNGGFAAAPNGGDVLIDALYSLKAPYRANATWFMNRATTKTVRKLKDSDGAYLWSPGIAAGQPATLIGYPVASFEDMPDSTVTGAKAIAVGDMRAAYQIVDRAGIRVLRDPYTSKPYVKFYTTKRVGGDVINFEAIKTISFQTT